LRHTNKGDLIEVILETLSLNDSSDKIIESLSSACDAVGAEHLIVHIKPLPAATAMAKWSIGRDELRRA
jgi:hypothetical protein